MRGTPHTPFPFLSGTLNYFTFFGSFLCPVYSWAQEMCYYSQAPVQPASKPDLEHHWGV